MPMDDVIRRPEHEEMLKRMEEEHVRLSKRITTVEEAVKENSKLIISVHELAMSVKEMQKEQAKLSEKMEEFEQIPTKNWNTIKSSILSAIGGAIGAALIAAIISFMK